MTCFSAILQLALGVLSHLVGLLLGAVVSRAVPGSGSFATANAGALSKWTQMGEVDRGRCAVEHLRDLLARIEAPAIPLAPRGLAWARSGQSKWTEKTPFQVSTATLFFTPLVGATHAGAARERDRFERDKETASGVSFDRLLAPWASVFGRPLDVRGAIAPRVSCG
jgi:hypothetical protein